MKKLYLLLSALFLTSYLFPAQIQQPPTNPELKTDNPLLVKDYPNIKFLINSDSTKNLGYDNYDPQANGEYLVIKNLICDGDIVFDIGANVGNWTDQVLSNYKNTFIYAFEPIPSLAESIKQRFNNQNNVKVFEAAIFSEQKTTTFDYYEKSSELSGIYYQNWITPWNGQKPKKITVECTTLDSFCLNKKIDHINFLKIDTEGCELDVLKGASNLLKKHAIDAIQFEYTITYPGAKITLKQVYDLLTSLGYSVFREYADGLIYIPQWHDSLEVYRFSNYIALANFEPTKNINNQFSQTQNPESSALSTPINKYDPLLVVVLMVKNEAPVIQKTLQPLVEAGLDSFFIFDTGSTDDTIARARKYFDDHHVAHAYIQQEPFIDFATSRNRALRLAEETFPNARFMLMLDAEWHLHNINELVQFCTAQANATDPSYLIRVIVGSLDYYVANLMRCRLNVHFVGQVHEVLNCVATKKLPPTCFFEWQTTHYGQEKSRIRWTRDREILLKEFEKHPQDPRTVFYLAQTNACLGDWKQAQQFYELRTTIRGWDEENFMARYRLAQAYEAMGTWDKALTSYLGAYSLRPHRAEPLVRLAQHYWDTGDKPLCYLFAQQAAALPYPTQDILFVEKELYDYTRYDLLGMSAWYVGAYEIGKNAILQALKTHPEAAYLQTNLSWYANTTNN